jgi:ATP/maltotriose-dependent transcriptional regulator MalT
MRSLGNLASSLLDLGRIAEAREALEEGAAAAQRFGSMWYRDWLAPERATYMYYEGAWDQAVAQIAELMADIADGGLTSFMESANLSVRARVRVARGDVAGGVEDAERSLDVARIAKNPQLLHPALAGLAAIQAEIGDVEEASRLVDELFENWRAHPILASAFWLIEAAYALVPLERGTELEEGLARTKARSKWAEAARAYVSGDFTTAADILAVIGSKPDEAYARLRSGTDADVRRALEFYRSVGASRYVAQGEALLPTSRTA